MVGVGGRGELHSPIGIERVRILLFGRWVIAEGGGYTEDLEKKALERETAG